MTDDLRERVLAMLDDDRYKYASRKEVALAVAAMMAEECALECERLSRKAMRLEYAECADAIRHRAEELR